MSELTRTACTDASRAPAWNSQFQPANLSTSASGVFPVANNGNRPSKPKIATAFRLALTEARDALPKAETKTGIVTADDLQRLLGPDGEHAQIRAIADDLLAVLAEIQQFRDSDTRVDQFLRQRGVVTRVRAVRPL